MGDAAESAAAPAAVEAGTGDPPSVELTWNVAGTSAPLAPRFDHSLAVVASPSGPKVYALGGLSSPSTPASVYAEALDPSHSGWSPVPAPPAPHAKAGRSAHASAVVDTTIVIIGGLVDGKATIDVVSYDMGSSSWDTPTIEGPAPPPRCHHTATAVGSLIYIIGGRQPSSAADASSASDRTSSSTVFNDVWALDWAAKKWVQPAVHGSPPPPLHSHTAVLLNDQQRILLFGGLAAKPKQKEEEAAPATAPTADTWILEVGTPYAKSLSSQSLAVAWSQASVGPPPRPVVICGPSGVGKGTLIAKLMAEFPDACGFSVSHTTRQPRPGEQDGVHYHFSTRDVMEREIADGKFLEKADVHGNLYGTSVAAVNAVTQSGKMCILDIDVQGAQQVKQNPHISATFVFVAPPSFEELEKRLRGRGTETEEAIQKRLRNAKAELERGEDDSLFHHRIVNDDLDNAYLQLKRIVGLAPKEDEEQGQGSSSATARYAHAAAAVDTRVVIHGGIDADGTSLGDLHVLETSSLTGGAPGRTFGLQVVELQPQPLTFWESIVSALGFTPDPQGNGDPAPPRSAHQAVSVGPSEVVLVGGRHGEADSGCADTVVLTVESA